MFCPTDGTEIQKHTHTHTHTHTYAHTCTNTRIHADSHAYAYSYARYTCSKCGTVWEHNPEINAYIRICLLLSLRDQGD